MEEGVAVEASGGVMGVGVVIEAGEAGIGVMGVTEAPGWLRRWMRGRTRWWHEGRLKVIIELHMHEGVFVAKANEDVLVKKNLVPGEDVYGEKRISVDNEDGTKTEYCVWNPFRSKLTTAILGAVDNIWIKPGVHVLYLGAVSGTTVSHVSDLVGPSGIVYAVGFSHRSGRDLVNMAKKWMNVIPGSYCDN